MKSREEIQWMFARATTLTSILLTRILANFVKLRSNKIFKRTRSSKDECSTRFQTVILDQQIIKINALEVAESFCSVRDIRHADPFLVVIIPSFCSERDESGENRRIVADKSASMLFT